MSQDQQLFGAPPGAVARATIEWHRPSPTSIVTVRMVVETEMRNKPITLHVHLQDSESVSAVLGLLNGPWMCSWYVGGRTMQAHLQRLQKRLWKEGYDCTLTGAGRALIAD